MRMRTTPERQPVLPRPIVIGLLGGIASGKSAAAALLAGARGVVVDADRIAREVLQSPEVRQEVVAAFGPAVLGPQGSVDRERLGALVFSSPEARATLERFTHPRIRAKIRAELEAARANRVPRVVLDVPLLLENDAQHHLVSECDVLVFVDADPRIRDARAVAGRGWPSGEVARRERAQMPLDPKRARADHVLTNDGTRASLEIQVRSLLERLGAEPD